MTKAVTILLRLFLSVRWMKVNQCHAVNLAKFSFYSPAKYQMQKRLYITVEPFLKGGR